MFNIIHTMIPGCFQIILKKQTDLRGAFIKTFHINAFAELNIKINFAEEYFSQSHKGVFRGMHFQTPPMAVDKIVYCVNGELTDYVFDLRIGSPTYGRYEKFELNGNDPKAIFIPIGLAHGFYSKADNTIMHYKASNVYDAACDTGILYKSLPFGKELDKTITSERDVSFLPFEKFNSPFIY